VLDHVSITYSRGSERDSRKTGSKPKGIDKIPITKTNQPIMFRILRLIIFHKPYELKRIVLTKP
jgi:hypothetical protein